LPNKAIRPETLDRETALERQTRLPGRDIHRRSQSATCYSDRGRRMRTRSVICPRCFGSTCQPGVDLNRLARNGFIKRGANIGGRGIKWTHSHWGEIATGMISADLSGKMRAGFASSSAASISGSY
jgi:hypothetical protein